MDKVRSMTRNILAKLWRKRKNKKLQEADGTAPYLNKPIENDTYDEIGMKVYVNYLESAIEQGASMVAVVSRFGTGKSSLIEMLKQKYHGVEQRNGRKFHRCYCQVNLWNQMEEKTGSIELHRTFLYQLIASIRPELGSYFSRRTSKNFGVLKINTNKPWRDAGIVLVVMLFGAVTVARAFSDMIIGGGLVQEKTLSTLILLGYAICIIFMVLLALRAEITFSSKNSEGKREAEENELIDLYRENILMPRRWYKLPFEKIAKRKHYVVVIEDLDRTTDGESVYHFLQELRKYYVPADQMEQTFRNRITFIVNIMPEDILRKRCQNEHRPGEYVYEKMFDYSLNLNRINIDNFDAILEALLQEKKNELTAIGINVQEDNNVHNIEGMQWIIYGKSLTLRDVKSRLNDALLLYESLRLKFGIEYADFTKCAVVAYLRNAYSNSFYQLKDRTLEQMLNWYATDLDSEKKFLEKFIEEKNIYGEAFLKEIYNLISKHLIDGNYRIYFFNYPKGSYLYSVQETQVRNLIIYDEELEDGVEEIIQNVSQNRKSVIVEAFDTVLELVDTLPYVTLESAALWRVAFLEKKAELEALLETTFSNIAELDSTKQETISFVMHYPHGPEMLCQVLQKNEESKIVEVRDYILERYPDKIENFAELFRLNQYPITEEELGKIQQLPTKTLLQFIPDTLENVSMSVIEQICTEIVTKKDRDVLAAAESFYNEMGATIAVGDIVHYLVDYMVARKEILPKLEEIILTGIEEGHIPTDVYYALLNGLPIEAVKEEQLENIDQMDEPGNVNIEICQKLQQQGRLKAYLENAIMMNNNLDFSMEQLQNVLVDSQKQIWERHPGIFLEIRKYICDKFKNESIVFKNLFHMPYPCITAEELRNISSLNVALELFDESRIVGNEEAVFAEYCNRQYRPSKEAYAIFLFVGRLQEPAVSETFYRLNMKKVKFAGMSMPKKKVILELLRIPLSLTESKEIIKFMDYTECLIPELEQEIADDLKEQGNKELQLQYVSAINKVNKVNAETIRNVVAMPTIHNYSELIDEELYRRKQYTMYVSSRIQKEKRFVLEYDKLDDLWPAYMRMIKSVTGFAYSQPIMEKNQELLKQMQERSEYKDMPEERRMIMATIPQDQGNLENVLTYSEEFVVKYFAVIVGFQDKNAAEKFVEIMKKHQKYAQRKEIYDHVYDKLENGNLKRAYTNLYKKATE